MNWYNVFYWVTIADGVKGFFDKFSNTFFTFSIIFFIIYGILVLYRNGAFESIAENDKKEVTYWVSSFRRLLIWSVVLCTITWMGYVFTPTKKDAIMIIAGGAVGNFITSDSSAKGIPAELTLLIREKMKSEIQELRTSSISQPLDTLANKTKEQLIEILKRK